MIYKDISDVMNGLLDENSRVLDLGGGKNPWFRATHILDKRDEQAGEILHGDGKVYFNKDNWINRDFFEMPWPFEDKYFDFCICADTLEDVRDPIAVIKEIQRVSKAGYFCGPTRAAESFIGGDKSPLADKLFGYFHHRWFVEIVDGSLQYTMKTPLLYQHNQWLTKKVGQKVLNYFWQDEVNAYENYLGTHDNALLDLENFFNKHEAWIRELEKGNYDPKMYNNWVESWGPMPDFQNMQGIMANY